jgi:hypothetical protein
MLDSTGPDVSGHQQFKHLMRPVNTLCADRPTAHFFYEERHLKTVRVRIVVQLGTNLVLCSRTCGQIWQSPPICDRQEPVSAICLAEGVQRFKLIKIAREQLATKTNLRDTTIASTH